MASTLRPHGFAHVMHDYGWQECGTTFAVQKGCIFVDDHGRLFPSPDRFPSTAVNSSYGSWKPVVDMIHKQGIALGLHLMHGVPKLAAAKKLPIARTDGVTGRVYTCDEIVGNYSGQLCSPFIPDHWNINTSHPGAAL
jgi:alpha-galactosidase